MRKTRLLAVALAGLAVTICGPPGIADDSDIFLYDTVAPNVVILIDNSGSMQATVDGVRKINIAKRTVSELIGNVEGVNFGLFTFNEKSTGGQLVAPIGTEVSVMTDAVNALSATGMTPLGEATQDIQDYFFGLYGLSAVSEQFEGASGDCVDDEDEDYDDEDEVPDCTGQPRDEPYESPVVYECQQSYAILVTDGMPTDSDQELVADVARSLYATDHAPDADGLQNVIVHTVSFDFAEGGDLLTRAASNGGGNYYAASSADELEAALIDAVSIAIEGTFSFSVPLMPSTSAAGGANAYFASFEPNMTSPWWNGHLKAYTRNSNGTVPLNSDGGPDANALAWDAGQLLADRTAASRTIFTDINDTLQPFTTANGSITMAMLGVSTAELREDVIEFIRGVDSYDHDLDGNETEDRDWKLGSIFHSDPVLVFPPPLSSSDDSYLTFKADNANRTTIVLAGANDGQLHAFNATDGTELWSYIPSDLLDDLRNLTSRLGSAEYFVDSSPVVMDIKVGDTWKTIAVFGERRGGDRYHALDITDTTAPVYMWSFTDAELGETWSKPAVGRVLMADGTTRFVAFVGGGYDTPANNASGRAFYVIDLATGEKLWEYRASTTGDKRFMNFSLAASPTAADTDGDGYVNTVYAVDVGGQMWKFDVSAAATTSAGMVDNWTGKRLFAADPSQVNPPASGEYYPAQGMYGTPALAFDTSGDLWVFVGTGDRNHPKEPSLNFFFGIKDNTSMSNGSALTPADLVDATTDDTVTQGWYYPLAADEKVLAGADVYNNLLFFTTYSPSVSDVCVQGTGSAALYALRLEDGDPGLDWSNGERIDDDSGTASIAVGGGIPSEPGLIVGSTNDTVVVGTTDGEVSNTTMPSALDKRIRYWREAFEDVQFHDDEDSDDRSEDLDDLERECVNADGTIDQQCYYEHYEQYDETTGQEYPNDPGSTNDQGQDQNDQGQDPPR